MSKTILVTGGAGFAGSNFVHYTRERFPDYKIVVLDALTYAGSVDNLPPRSLNDSDDSVQFRYGNILNADLVDSIMRQVHLVVHFAAETHVTRSIFNNRDFFETDVLGTQTLVNAFLRHRESIERFIHISTSEVYGTAHSEKMSEDHPLLPMSPYAAAKCGADRLMYSYWQTYQLPITIIRPFNMYGPRQHLEKVIPRFITSALIDEPLTIHGDGSAARDFFHVEDLCRGIHNVIECEKDLNGDVINMASGDHITISQVAHHILKRLGKDPSNYSNVGDRPGQVFRHTGDWSHAKSILGWEPKIDFTAGLNLTIDWYKENREQWERQLWMRQIPILTDRGKMELH